MAPTRPPLKKWSPCPARVRSPLKTLDPAGLGLLALQDPTLRQPHRAGLRSILTAITSSGSCAARANEWLGITSYPTAVILLHYAMVARGLSVSKPQRNLPTVWLAMSV